jgi:hypothetical protein
MTKKIRSIIRLTSEKLLIRKCRDKVSPGENSIDKDRPWLERTEDRNCHTKASLGVLNDLDPFIGHVGLSKAWRFSKTRGVKLGRGRPVSQLSTSRLDDIIGRNWQKVSCQLSERMGLFVKDRESAEARYYQFCSTYFPDFGHNNLHFDVRMGIGLETLTPD